MDALLVGLIWLLVYVLIVCVICYIIARLAAQFLPGAAAYTWIIWCIAGLIIIIMALRLLGPALPH